MGLIKLDLLIANIFKTLNKKSIKVKRLSDITKIAIYLAFTNILFNNTLHKFLNYLKFADILNISKIQN